MLQQESKGGAKAPIKARCGASSIGIYLPEYLNDRTPRPSTPLEEVQAVEVLLLTALKDDAEEEAAAGHRPRKRFRQPES